MNTENRITLKEMAAKLNRCPKTFRKYVIKYRIPHICLGRDMLFNALEVENYLIGRTLSLQINEPVENSLKIRSRIKKDLEVSEKSKDHYANLLGLG